MHHLWLSYRLVLDKLTSNHPLYKVQGQKRSWAWNLWHDDIWTLFQTNDQTPTRAQALRRFLQDQKEFLLREEARKTKLLAYIPWEIRRVPSLRYADITLAAHRTVVDFLLQYRRGIFLVKRMCHCRGRFMRGHETCKALRHPDRLNKKERYDKARMLEGLGGPNKCKLTDVDYLLNTGQIQRVAIILLNIRQQINDAFSQNQGISDLELSDSSNDDSP